MSRTFLLIAAAALSGCTQFPELDARITDDSRVADWPELVDIGPILAETRTFRLTPDITTSLEARVAALRARAVWLRRYGAVDAETRARMRAALGRHATLERP